MDKPDTAIELIAFPEFAPDETVFSMLARAHCLGGYESAVAASRAILGDERAALLFDFPRRLEELGRLIPGRLSDPAALAINATCLPFFTRFRDRSVEERAIQKMCGPSVAALKDDLGLRASAAGPQSTVKACPDCMAEDTATHGIAYWHRILQLPGVTVCPIHRVPLLESAPVRQGKQRTLFLPHELRWTYPVTRNQEAATYKCSLRLANLAAAALSYALPGGFQPLALYYTYRHGLKAGGFLSRGNRLRFASLERLLDAHVGKLPASIRLCRPELSRETNSLLTILRAKQQTFNTLPHLVLIDFLFESWDHFVSTYEWEHAMNAKVNAHGGLSTDRVPSEVRSRRSHTLQMESRWDRCTTAILRYMKEQPDCTRSQLVKVCGGPWRWLYRNDREWLDANAPAPLPRRRRYLSWVNWQKRDATLVELIEREDRIAGFPKNARITPKTVLRNLGPIPFSVQLEKMPKSSSKLSEIVEQIRAGTDNRVPAS
ncbi:TnsD family Tn7-like transposition protein [Trinickia sp. YCB016]